MSTYLTHALVLNIKPWREADRLYTLYTKKVGKVQVVAAGARKVLSKLAPHLSLFSETEVMLAHGKLFDRLAGANLQINFLSTTQNPRSAALSQVVLEIANLILPESTPDEATYQLLKNTLQDINQIERITDNIKWRVPAYRILLSFLHQILKQAGLTLAVGHCESCRNQLVQPFSFVWEQHGFVHNKCLLAGIKYVPVSEGLGNWFLSGQAAEVLPDTTISAALSFMLDYLSGHVGRELKSVKVLKSLMV
ncbi:MAG: DNA repair protein RecO [Patescibacteria group bacterium]